MCPLSTEVIDKLKAIVIQATFADTFAVLWCLSSTLMQAHFTLVCVSVCDRVWIVFPSSPDKYSFENIVKLDE